MDFFVGYFSYIIDLFKIPMTLYGYTFSLWDVFLFTLVAAIVLRFIGGVIYD